MGKKFAGKYRIESARLPYWDYGSNAAYFVTICTQNSVPFFGEIIETPIKLMHLSEIGLIADQCWQDILKHFPFVILGEHIIMPDHVHGIIIINKSSGDCETSPNKCGPQSKNLASIVRGFKIGVTKNARKLDPEFTWQPRYHDQIIWNKSMFITITKYIRNNPVKWTDDG